MKPNDPQIHSLTGAYALNALPDDERQAFEEHLADCEPCSQETAEFVATSARLGGLLREQTSPSLRSDLLAQIEQTPQEPRVDPGQDGRDEARLAGAPSPVSADDGEVVRLDERRRAVPRWVASLSAAAAGIAAVAAVALGVQLANVNQELDSVSVAQAQLEELLVADDARTVSVTSEQGAQGSLVLSASRGEAVFLAANLEPAPHEHTYELWVIDERGPQKAGIFDTGEDGRVTQVVEGDIASAAAIGVTVEPEGGSPEPTTDPFMVIELSG